MIIQLSPQTITVLDQHSKVRTFDIKIIRNKKNMVSRTSTLVDSRHNQVHEGDAVSIVEGEYKGRNGMVKRIWRNYVYIHSKEVPENNGIMLVRNRQVELDESSQRKNQFDSKDHFEVMSVKPGSVDYSSTKQGSRNKKDNLRDGTMVMVKIGRFKGLRGYVFDSNGNDMRI